MAAPSPQRMIASSLRAALSVLFAWCSVASSARAEPELALSWPALPGCPQSAWVEQRVREHLGRAFDDRAPHALRASAAITPQGSGLTLSLRVKQDESEGVREMSAASCAELAEAAALVIAIALDATAAAPRKNEPSDLVTPGEARPPADQRPPTREPQAASAQPPKLVSRPWRAFAGVVLDVGSLPSTSVGPVAAIGYQWGRYRVELAGAWLSPRATSGDLGRVTVSAWAVAPTGCAELIGQKAVLASCVAVELGRSTGRGQKLQESVQAGALHVAGSLGMRLSVPVLANAALFAESAALVPFQRARFVSVDTNAQDPLELHEAAKVSLRARFAAELRF